MDYFKGKSWKTITREERLFCTYLYFDIKKDVKKFIYWISKQLNLKLEEDMKWEPGYEVCFYRDFIEEFGKDYRLSKKDYPRKRTFDLCLFGEKEILIIEAKAYGGFELKQLDYFLEDRKLINDLMDSTGEKDVDVKILGLASSGYLQRARRFKKINDQKKVFDGIITWKEMHHLFGNEIYLHADKR